VTADFVNAKPVYTFFLVLGSSLFPAPLDPSNPTGNQGRRTNEPFIRCIATVSLQGIIMAADTAMNASALQEPKFDVHLSEKEEIPKSEPRLYPSEVDDLSLPLSSADGLVKKPFARPLDSALPVPRPPLNTEQQSKYEDLLKVVSSWTEVPDSSAKGASKTVITDSERLFLTRDCLLRYLRATKWVTVDAEARLLGTLVWRREYGVERLTPEYTENENATGKQVITGYDVNARPCHYLVPSRQNTERSDKQIQHLVFMLERVIDLMVPGQETLALLINFAETKSGQGASVGQGRQTLYILQNHYPERLGRALVTNGESHQFLCN
jgi:CRAL/TRIO domain/CRAL/TRIO, N-terminal domain